MCECVTGVYPQVELEHMQTQLDFVVNMGAAELRGPRTPYTEHVALLKGMMSCLVENQPLTKEMQEMLVRAVHTNTNTSMRACTHIETCALLLPRGQDQSVAPLQSQKNLSIMLKQPKCVKSRALCFTARLQEEKITGAFPAPPTLLDPAVKSLMCGSLQAPKLKHSHVSAADTRTHAHTASHIHTHRHAYIAHAAGCM